MMMAGAYAPPISLFSVLPEKRETGRARSKEKRERRREFDQLLFPRFAPTLSRSGKKARLPAVGRRSCPNVPDQARSAGREESPCVHASSLLSALQSKRKISATTKKSFSLLDRARPVFSFSARRKRENGGCIPHGEAVHPRPAPWGGAPAPAYGRTPPKGPLP